MIPFDEIEKNLKKAKIGDEISFIKHGDDKIRKSFYDGFRNGVHWVQYSDKSNLLATKMNDMNLFPNKSVEILKIGRNQVQRKKDFEEIEAIKMQLDKERKGKESQINYRDAYVHGKAFPNVEESKQLNEVRMIVRRLIQGM